MSNDNCIKIRTQIQPFKENLNASAKLTLDQNTLNLTEQNHKTSNDVLAERIR